MHTKFSGLEIYEVDKLMLEASCQEDETEQSKLLAQARTLLENALPQNQSTSELYYLLGLCWYEDPKRSNQIRFNIEKYFKLAIKFNPKHRFASLYLGHFYFDEARYEKALPLFLSASYKYFKKLGQKWRIVKNKELILCCRLYIDPAKVTILDVEKVCSAYENTEYIDRPVPLEIIECLSKLMVTAPVIIIPIIPRVLAMVEHIDYQTAKSIEQSYSFLRKLISNQG